MANNDELINILRAALEASPGNVQLRKQFADLLMEAGAYHEAEEAYRLVLNATPDDARVRFLLAKAFYFQQKEAVALVILERLMAEDNPLAEVFLLSARSYWQAGQVEQAREAYRQAVARDPTLADSELANVLQVGEIEPMAMAVPEADDRVVLTVEDPVLPPHVDLEQSKISFKDVGGMEKLKEEIRLKIIHPLSHPEIYEAYGKKVGGGILMYGPPGCGKTHLARATAGEVNAYFLSIGLHDVLNMYLGQSEQNLHELFELARRYAPCVLFIDEVDALGANRTDMRRSAGRQLINQFLAELDGIDQSNEGVLILAATNAPWHLDPAFRRPGRFDRVIFVPPPDLAARAAIARILLLGKPTENIDFERLAQKTDSFSGADLKGAVDAAVENKLREAMKKGVPMPIGMKDLLTAVKQTKPSTKDWFASARNYALYANQSGLYDDILDYLKLNENRDLASKLAFWKDQ